MSNNGLEDRRDHIRHFACMFKGDLSRKLPRYRPPIAWAAAEQGHERRVEGTKGLMVQSIQMSNSCENTGRY